MSQFKSNIEAVRPDADFATTVQRESFSSKKEYVGVIVNEDGSENGNGDRYPDEDGIVHDGGKLSVYCPRICDSVRFPLDKIICASTEHPAAILGLGVDVGCDSSLFSSELVGAMEVDDDDVPSLSESAVAFCLTL